MLIAGDTGQVLARTSQAEAEVRSIAFDPLSDRVLQAAFEDIDAGKIVGVPLAPGEPPAFGAPQTLARIDGDARFLGTELGIVTFEQTYPSWGWSWSGAASNATAPLPAPVSVWLEGGARLGSVRIEALTYGDPALPEVVLTRQAAVVSAEGLSAEPSRPLAGFSGEAMTARLVPSSLFGDAIVIAIEDGAVTARPVEDTSVGALLAIQPTPFASRIEAAAPLAGGRMVAVVTTGPDRLVLLSFGDRGAEGVSAAMDLPGAFALSDRFFSEDLLALGDDRVLVATDAGVVAVDVMGGRGEVLLAVDQAFDGALLRGPLSPAP